MILGIVLPVLAGVLATLSTLAITYPAHLAGCAGDREEHTPSKCNLASNLVLTGCSTVVSILALGQGKVAIVFPLQTASNLVSNMVTQSALGMGECTKSVAVGTLVLVVAVSILPQVGPSQHTQALDAFELLSKPQATAFICFCFVLILSCGLALFSKRVRNNTALIFLWAAVGGTGTVINASIAKVVQEDLYHTVKLSLGVVYVLLAALCLLSSALANGTLEDPSTYVPISMGLNLILNALAGIFVWGDGEHLTFAWSYTMVYVIVVLGTYLVTSLDLSAIIAGEICETHLRRIDRQQTLKSKFFDHLELGKPLPSDCDDSVNVVKHVLSRGLDQGTFRHHDIAQLVTELLQEVGGAQESETWHRFEQDHRSWIRRLNTRSSSLRTLRASATMPTLLEARGEDHRTQQQFTLQKGLSAFP
jgi:FtsH-binding integral membrane protein